MAKLKFGSGTSFGLKKAHSLAKASLLAYDDPANIEKQVIDVWKFDNLQFFHKDDTQGYAMVDAKRIVIAFRGTEPILVDWLTNLDFDLAPGPFGGEVHRGFTQALDAVWTQVDRTISRFRQNTPKSIWFTGHSLGAALATLAAARRRDADQRVDGLYTFGQPRTGDCQFARNFNADFKTQTFRFVNNNDVVTRIPPRSAGYSHVGSLKYLNESGELVDDVGWWWEFLDRMRGRIEDIFEWGADGLRDHSMDAYATLIGELT
jgi:triacylglycerol lipase